ncbi:MAG: orotidine-5'-phosphate decarboxylase [Gammaproteobacteria bacterium]
MRYSERANSCRNVLAKKLLRLMDDKKSNLALSADVTTSEKLLSLADEIGPEICVLKTHIDIIEDFTPALTKQLISLAKKHQFILFEDRKFADIGNTVKLQYQKGIYHIADWADLINAHSLPGDGIVTGLSEVGIPKQRGLLLLAEMSSANNLFSTDYTQKTLAMAEQFPDFVIGFIAQRKLADRPDWIYLTPGVQFSEKNDAHGQQYITPQKAIVENSTDIIIVGRGIIQANDPVSEARKYRDAAWLAYESILSGE